MKKLKEYWKKVARLRKEKYEYSILSWTTQVFPFFETRKTRRCKPKKDKTLYIY
jgi:hypothetical protein